jgi:hypothetical protein
MMKKSIFVYLYCTLQSLNAIEPTNLHVTKHRSCTCAVIHNLSLFELLSIGPHCSNLMALSMWKE